MVYIYPLWNPPVRRKVPTNTQTKEAIGDANQLAIREDNPPHPLTSMLIVTVASPIDIIPRINFGSWGRGWGKGWVV